MRLDITTPFATVLHTDEAVHVRAEDASGAFGILRGHADFLTVLGVSVLTWRDGGASEHYVALRGGVLSVRDGNSVTVTTGEAVMGEDLRLLEAEVLTRFRHQADEERAAHTEAQRLHLAAIRQIMRLLRPEPGHAPTVG
jgi:F-type H+-transporting ATPase subunit epsilon